jgi:CBS domain-containing protein
MKTVAELMTRDVETLSADDSLVLADTLMRRRRIRHLPVVRAGRLVGVVTHRDLLRAQAEITARIPVSDEERFVSLAVGDLMTTDVKTASPDEPARDAAQRMLESKLGCLPVVDPEGQLVGIVTEVDFLRWAITLVGDA